MAANSAENHGIVEVVLEKQGKGLGFSIRGGIDYIHAGDDPGIFVTSVKHEGAAARSGVIKPGDKILEIDGHDLRSVNHSQAVEYFHNTSDRVVVKVEQGAEQRIMNNHHIPINSLIEQNKKVSTNRKWLPVALVLMVGVIIGLPCGYLIYRRLR